MTTEHTSTDEISQDEIRGDENSRSDNSRLSTDRDDSAPADDAEHDEAPADDAEHEDEDEDAAEGDNFPRPYVERLRARSAGYRTRANDAEARADTLSRALFTERVRALDVLTDPTDLPYDADMLEDPESLARAVDDLVTARPHYARRGTVGSDATGARDRADGDSVSLFGLMRAGS